MMLSIGVAGFQAGRPAIHPTRAVRAVRGESACMMAGKVVVTDGTSSFYESRGIFQSLHDHGDFSGIEAYSSGSGTTADAKKMLLSRNARYSGLLDLLTFSEGEPAEAFAGADTWLSINSDGATVSAQLAAAKAAGVKRVLLHYSANGPTDGTNADSLSGELSGLTYTVLRTGTLTKESGGGGMKVGELADPTCGEATKDDVYRIITEALSLDSASGKMLSLCSTDDVVQLKAMRQAGCTRREEADALLGGKIKETEVVAEAEETAEQKAERTKTETQKSEERKASHPPHHTTLASTPTSTPPLPPSRSPPALTSNPHPYPTCHEPRPSRPRPPCAPDPRQASDEDELAKLIAKARQRGAEAAAEQAILEAEKAAMREERDAYYKTLPDPMDSKDKNDKDDDDKDDDEPPPPPKSGDRPDEGDGGKGKDEGDGLQAA